MGMPCPVSCLYRSSWVKAVPAHQSLQPMEMIIFVLVLMTNCCYLHYTFPEAYLFKRESGGHVHGWIPCKILILQKTVTTSYQRLWYPSPRPTVSFLFPSEQRIRYLLLGTLVLWWVIELYIKHNYNILMDWNFLIAYLAFLHYYFAYCLPSLNPDFWEQTQQIIRANSCSPF